jgi:hypothetical protein
MTATYFVLLSSKFSDSELFDAVRSFYEWPEDNFDNYPLGADVQNHKAPQDQQQGVMDLSVGCGVKTTQILAPTTDFSMPLAPAPVQTSLMVNLPSTDAQTSSMSPKQSGPGGGHVPLSDDGSSKGYSLLQIASLIWTPVFNIIFLSLQLIRALALGQLPSLR